jgi:gluconolactonase
MNPRRTAGRVAIVAALAATSASPTDAQHAVRQATDGRPDAVVDLRTSAGVELVHGEWRYSDARLIDVQSRAPGADLRPSGEPVTALDIAPHAGGIDFNDSTWQRIAPASLESRRTSGRLSFNWYRINVTIPERIGAFETAGSTVVFEVVVDDYSEVWVDGRLPRPLGQTGSGLVKGFNAPNRVVVTKSARPNQKIQLAVFGANAPLSEPPNNFIWVRSATLDFYKASPPVADAVRVVRNGPALDAIVPADLKAERLAEGFLFTEGPVWVPDGYLLFSDPNANTIYRWSDNDGLSVFRTKSGYSGPDIGDYRQPGSNGLALDAEGRVTINEHGNRRVTRLEKTGALAVLADRYQGRRLNSPNDLVYRSDGSLYFTDPFFGLPKFSDDPRTELPYAGVFRLANGQLELLTSELNGPNGLAFSPDERYLYVGNWDEKKKIIMRYDVRPDGSLSHGTVFFDMTNAPGEDAIDGVKVDLQGNVYVSGPGGLWILTPAGKHLGTIVTPEHPHNMAWGDDGSSLFLTARSVLYRIRLRTSGTAATPRATANAQTAAEREIVARVHKAIERLPYYGVFDFLAFGIDRGTVTLSGYAYRGSLKAEAVQAVRRIAGVQAVVDRIELLPASQRDESIRSATFANIYGDDHFSRYIPGGAVTIRDDFNLLSRFPNMQPVGMYPIHIIVRNLRTTLVGVVDTDLDKALAVTRARAIPGALSVDIEVMVAGRRASE